jgi:membrane protein DedA with SNARE-associated domain
MVYILRNSVFMATIGAGDSAAMCIGLFLWSIPGNYMFGFLPQEAAILFAAQYLRPAVVTAVVVPASVLAELLNYYTLYRLKRVPKISDYLQNPLVRTSIRWFRKAPAATLTIVTFLPIVPVFPLRIITPLSGYPVKKYIAAVVAGRLPRVYLVALFGFTVHVPVWMLALGTAATLCLIVASRIGTKQDCQSEVDTSVIERSL